MCSLFQLPSEVFLELSAGDKCLGLVYISLWKQLRRAQQLLALCLGTLGPSYLGAQGRVIQTDGGKYLSFHYYQSSDGCEGSQHILTNLERGPMYEKPTKPGLVMHTRRNDVFGCDDYTSLSICIETCNEGSSKCPLGEVVAGMEVLETAVTQRESTVTITQCGLLPFPIKHESQQPSSPVSSSSPVKKIPRRAGRTSYLVKSGRGRRR